MVVVERRRVRAFENERSKHFCECVCGGVLGVGSGEGEMGFYQVSCCCSNLKLIIRLFLFSIITISNNLPSKIYCKNIINISFLFYHFILVKIVQ